MRRWRVLWHGATTAALIVASVLVGTPISGRGPDPALAATGDGLAVESTYTYTVDPTANVVHVVAEMSFTNTVPNQVDGNYINKTYFTGFVVPLPTEAVAVAASQDGRAITATPDYVDGVTTLFTESLDFADNLFYNRTANVVLTYDIIGHPPRDEAPTRVNGAYVSFGAYGIADAGRLTVRVVVPAGYVIDTFGDEVEPVTDGGNTVYTATEIAQPDEFTLFVSARNDAALVIEPHPVADADFVVQSWPDDPTWKDFVQQHLDTAVPALEQAIGLPWPEREPIVITEAVTSYLYGYAGFYDAFAQQLEIGEDLDPQVIAHELGHAWFNQTWFSARWIGEGLAQTYSDIVDQAGGEAAVSPTPIDPDAPGAQALNAWGETFDGESAGDEEEYGYNASWFVVDAMVDDIGVEAMRAIFAAIEDQTIPYAGDVPAERLTAVGDWRRLLDLAENVGASTVAEDLFEQYVATPDQMPLLTDRTAARAAYDQLVTTGGEWAPPFFLRRLMSIWLFDSAQGAIEQSSSVLGRRDALQTASDDLEVDLDPSIEAAYESATDDLDDVTAMIDEAQAAVDHALESRKTTIAAVEALGATPGAAFAASYHPPGAGVTEIEENLAVIVEASDRVADAVAHVGRPRVFASASHGANGDADALLAASISALTDGDVAGAVSAADDAVATVDRSDAATVGAAAATSPNTVVVAALVAVPALAVVAILLLVVRRRRRRSKSSDGGVSSIEEPVVAGTL